MNIKGFSLKTNACMFSYLIIIAFYNMFMFLEYTTQNVTKFQLVHSIIYSFVPFVIAMILYLFRVKENRYNQYIMVICFLTTITAIMIHLKIFVIAFFAIIMANVLLIYHERYLQFIYSLYVIVLLLLTNYIIFFFDYLSTFNLYVSFLGVLLIIVNAAIGDLLCQVLEQNDETEKNLKDYILKDQLTRAYNRNFIVDNIVFELNSSKEICIAFIDVDEFKYINDNFGHDFGDMVLQKFSSIVMKTISTEDSTFLVRMGGDEFMIVAIGMNYDYFIKLINKVRTKIINTTFEKNKVKTYIKLSIGCTSTNEVASRDFDLLYKLGDERLYEAKKNGKNQVVFK